MGWRRLDRSNSGGVVLGYEQLRPLRHKTGHLVTLGPPSHGEVVIVSTTYSDASSARVRSAVSDISRKDRQGTARLALAISAWGGADGEFRWDCHNVGTHPCCVRLGPT